jgi:hypothetical protein
MGAKNARGDACRALHVCFEVFVLDRETNIMRASFKSIQTACGVTAAEAFCCCASIIAATQEHFIVKGSDGVSITATELNFLLVLLVASMASV